MSRAQAGCYSSTKQQPVKGKTTAVHKEAAFRQAASDWTQKSKEVQGLDVLERCKKLNAFLGKVRCPDSMYARARCAVLATRPHAACWHG
jgi:hypothetical protein